MGIGRQKRMITSTPALWLETSTRCDNSRFVYRLATKSREGTKTSQLWQPRNVSLAVFHCLNCKWAQGNLYFVSVQRIFCCTKYKDWFYRWKLISVGHYRKMSHMCPLRIWLSTWKGARMTYLLQEWHFILVSQGKPCALLPQYWDTWPSGHPHALGSLFLFQDGSLLSRPRLVNHYARPWVPQGWIFQATVDIAIDFCLLFGTHQAKVTLFGYLLNINICPGLCVAYIMQSSHSVFLLDHISYKINKNWLPFISDFRLHRQH